MGEHLAGEMMGSRVLPISRNSGVVGLYWSSPGWSQVCVKMEASLELRWKIVTPLRGSGEGFDVFFELAQEGFAGFVFFSRERFSFLRRQIELRSLTRCGSEQSVA
jgi:hypothetical protein